MPAIASAVSLFAALQRPLVRQRARMRSRMRGLLLGRLRGAGSACALALVACSAVAQVPAKASAQAPAQVPTTLPTAHDLRASAQQAASHGQPLVLMFSLPDCTYCEQLRRNTYRWLLRDGIPVEQLEMLPDARVRDFDGRATDGKALARHYGVNLAPTVLFLGPGGKELGGRLVGAGQPDFYQADVDRSLQQARERLHAGGRAGLP